MAKDKNVNEKNVKEKTAEEVMIELQDLSVNVNEAINCIKVETNVYI